MEHKTYTKNTKRLACASTFKKVRNLLFGNWDLGFGN